MDTPSSPTVLSIQEQDVHSLFRKLNPHKAPGLDDVSPSTLRHRFLLSSRTPGFTDIFNSSLESCRAPACFKPSTIVPIPKNLCSKTSSFSSTCHQVDHQLPDGPAAARAAVEECLRHSEFSTGSRQGGVLSPLLFSLYINYWTSSHQSVKPSSGSSWSAMSLPTGEGWTCWCSGAAAATWSSIP